MTESELGLRSRTLNKPLPIQYFVVDFAVDLAVNLAVDSALKLNCLIEIL